MLQVAIVYLSRASIELSALRGSGRGAAAAAHTFGAKGRGAWLRGPVTTASDGLMGINCGVCAWGGEECLAAGLDSREGGRKQLRVIWHEACNPVVACETA